MEDILYNIMKQCKKYNKLYDNVLKKENLQFSITNNDNYMVLDIETTGLSNKDYIIQIAYNMYDIKMNCLLKRNYLINEHVGRTDYFNRFTLKEIKQNGLSAELVLNNLKNDLSHCKYIIGHNISFDIDKITNYYKKYKIECVMQKSICTMTLSKYKLNLRNVKGYIKNPKLSELYKYYYLNDANDNTLHDASYDIEITFLCFKKLVDDKLIII